MSELTVKQCPWTETYGLPGSGHRAKGPTAEACKRALSRMGAPTLPWTDFDAHYNAALEAAWDWVDPGKNGYGKGRWELLRGLVVPKGRPNGGEFALDRYGRTLIQDEAGQTAESTAEERVQAALTEWGYAIIRNKDRIGYSQSRPVDVSEDPYGWFNSDCSGTIIQGYHYARTKTGLDVPDPAKMRYTGYGNTDLFEDDHPTVGQPYRVGDLAHFQNSRHVIMCIRPGDRWSAEWVSHGRAAGPELVRLATYRPDDFMKVVRPPLVV